MREEEKRLAHEGAEQKSPTRMGKRKLRKVELKKKLNMKRNVKKVL
jgi:hypothetical protein